ncbi:MAG: hypothetical protein PUF72_07310 [Clostridiales bacterium]|nr:hypothetical protein [Clostridiales bacterium]
MYNYIINAVLRFAKTNNIDIQDNRLDHQIISDILNRPVNYIGDELYKLIDTVTAQGSSKKNNNADIIEYIEKNFCNPDLSVKMLADIFDASTSTVSATAVKRTGMGVRDFINYLKRTVLTPGDYRIETQHLL